MSDQPSEPQDQSEPQEGEAKVFDAEYVDKLRKEAARYRNEAKSNAEAAKRLAQLEEAQKSDTEKVADRIAKAEAEVASVPAKVAEALKGHLVALHGIDEKKAELYLTATEPELLLRQVTGLVELTDKPKKNHVPREGATPPSQPHTEELAFVREIFGSG